MSVSAAAKKSQVIRVKKPEILQEISHQRHAIIEASAGTGKTYTIEHLVVDLLLHHPKLRIGQILVVTFTERATLELSARIRKLLQAIVDADESVLAADEDAAWEVTPQQRQQLRRALGAFDLAAIHTIHGFCHRILVENAFQSHRPFEQEHVGFDAIFDKVFKDALRREFAGDEAFRGYLAAWMQSESTGIDGLRNLLARCFRARGEVRPMFDAQRFSQAVRALHGVDKDALDKELRAELVAEKIHGNTVKAILKRCTTIAEAIARYSSDAQPAELLGVVGHKDVLDYMRGVLEKYDFSGSIGQRIRALIEVTVPLKPALVGQFLPVLRRKMREYKDVSGKFSYDDMLSMVWESLESERGPMLLSALRERYPYALIDEFQDTDDLQWKIFRRIFHESEGSNICYLIGDPKQAIYSFRGADIHTYLRARAAVVEAGGGFVRLDKNYRSTAEVIAGYNFILDQEASPAFFSGDIAYDAPVRCGAPGRKLLDTQGRAAPALKLVQLVDPQPSADRLKEGIAAHFATQMRAMLSGERGLVVVDEKGGTRRAICARDIFVLTRTRREGEQLAEFLRAEGVPYAFFKQDGLFQTREAEHVRDLLAAIARPHERSALLKAWLTPFFGLDLGDLEQADALDESHRLLGDLLDWQQLAARRQYEILFNSILQRTGILRAEIFASDGERALTNYLHLFELLLDEAREQQSPLDELLLRLSAYIQERREPAGEDGNVQRLETDRQAVQIMTMHKAKGLEAEVVFLFGGFNGSNDGDVTTLHDEAGEALTYVGAMPDELKARWDRQTQEEAQRLLYVALTRAKSRLYLPYVGFENAAPAAGEDAPPRDYAIGGAYAPVMARLDAVAAELARGGAAQAGDGYAVGDIFALERVEYEQVGRSVDGDARRRALEGWEPPTQLPAPLDDAEFAPLRARCPVMTSYTQLKAMHQGWRPYGVSATAALELDDFRADGGQQIEEILGPNDLPGGKHAGIFLHALLEQVDLEHARTLATRKAWLQDEALRALIRRNMHVAGIAEKYLDFCTLLLWRALKTPLVATGAVAPQPIALPALVDSPQVLRELEFIFPLTPQNPRSHLLHTTPGTVYEVADGGGFLKGFIDLIFESGDKYYFADWKSDILADYGPAALEACVAERYSVQAVLYTLAMVKFLGIADEAAYEAQFGGYFYLFVRGMGFLEAPPDAGIYFRRPSWADVQEFARRTTSLEV